MNKPFDAVGKDAFELAPAGWVAIFGQPRPESQVWLIDADLSGAVTTATDKVFHVNDPEPWLILAEIQSSWDGDLPCDMLRRYAMLKHRHRKTVSCVVVLLRPEANSSGMTGRFYQPDPINGGWDFPFKVIPLWEQPVETFLTGPIALLPFAPLAAVAPESAPELTQRIKERLEGDGTRADKEWVRTCLFQLLALRYNDVGIAYWRDLTATLDISKTYLAELIRSEGRTEGRDDGRLEEARNTILAIGSRRYGEAPADVASQISALADLDRLHALRDRLFDATSWQDLVNPRAQ
jgi:hypothetical protein